MLRGIIFASKLKKSLRLLTTIWFYNIMKKMQMYASCCYRGVAQLVARLLWEQDVGGSSPFTPIDPRKE